MGYFKDWWKSLFSGSGETDELGFPVLKREDILPMPEVKPPKPEKEISEPVLSFIEVYKANPKRFKVRTIWSEHENQYGSKDLVGFELRDTKANKRFSLNREYAGYTIRKSTEKGVEDEYVEYYIYSPVKNTFWMTADERKLVFETVETERLERGNSLLARKEKLQRERLTKLYKGE